MALLLGGCLLVLFGTAEAARAASYETAVENHLSTGDINIRLDEYEQTENGTEIPYRDPKQVLPGMRVSKIARVTNLMDDAWIRIRVFFQSEEPLPGLDESVLELSSDRWVYTGGCYYWPEPVAQGESVDFLQSVKIPAEWTEREANRTFQILIAADAVQAQHFLPDFSSSDPWFGTPVEACVHGEQRKSTFSGKQRFSVEFQGEAEGLVAVGDDFFANWQEMLPGDTVQDSAVIQNRFGRPVRIFFRSETAAEKEEDILSEHLLLTIRNGAEILYDGPLSEIVTEKLLGEFGPGEQGTLTYRIRVPWELNNRYALQETATKWIFRCEFAPEEKKTGEKTPDPGKNSGGGGKDPAPQSSGTPSVLREKAVIRSLASKETEAAETGDGSHAGLYILLCASCAVLAVLSAALLRKEKR